MTILAIDRRTPVHAPLRAPTVRTPSPPLPGAFVGIIRVLVGLAATAALAGCGSASGDDATGDGADVAAAVDGVGDVEVEPASGRGDPPPPGGDDDTIGPPPPPGTVDLDGSADVGAGAGEPPVRTGADVLAGDGFDLLVGRRVGLIANRASSVDGRALIDVLHERPDIDLAALFAPEHGLGADGAAGVAIADGVDATTGLVVHSLYGDDRAPRRDDLAGLDVLVFDLQDAGARFYTYTSTLGLAMRAAADAGLPMVVLDRPNPLGGDRPDGPVRQPAQSSFVGLYPVPALHGLTTGELALAIQGEGWLDGLADLDLEVIELDGWQRTQRWPDTELSWIPPSPGLPSAEISLLYPATVLLEATTISFGRGTDRPFGQVGAPWLDADALVADLDEAELEGVRFAATTVPAEPSGSPMPGVRLEVTDAQVLRPFAIGVHLLAALLDQAGDRSVIERPRYLDRLAGSSSLRLDLVSGRDPSAIIDEWSSGLEAWETTRAPYLLYGRSPTS